MEVLKTNQNVYHVDKKDCCFTSTKIITITIVAILGIFGFNSASAKSAESDSTSDSLSIQTTTDDKDLPRTTWALRTNALLPLLNVGAELPIGNRWSIGADYYYPWQWRKSNHKNCFEFIFVSAEARYWFGSKHTPAPENHSSRLMGHSVGIYGAWGYYDFEHNYHGHQGHGYSTGLDYLFALPIAKGRMHLEFQAAVGGVYSQAQPYNVKKVGGHLLRERDRKKKFTYFGPTKLAMSLVIPFCHSKKSIKNSTEP